MNSELLATCSSLGYLEDSEYFKDENCVDNVKYLIKYLLNEDSTRNIRIQLGSAQVMQNDLIPLLTQNDSDKQLFQTVLRLVVNLTQPALLCFNGHIPKDVIMNHHFLEVLSHNQAYKEAFSNNTEIWKVVAQKVYDVLETPWEDRMSEDCLMVERILVFIRNLLHTPPTSEDEEKTESDMSTHDKLLWKLHEAGIDSVLLFMSSSQTEMELSLHIVEIICLMFKEQKAEKLAKTGAMTTEIERQKEGDELMALRKIENSKKSSARAKMNPWHSRFGGTFVSRGVKALSDNKDIILHHSVRQCGHVHFDVGKAKLRKARNRRALVEDTKQKLSPLAMRKVLKEFCVNFLESSYNTLQRAVKDRLSREKAQDHDETYYFEAMSFFLDFNRACNFRIELVSETMQLSTLHFIDTHLTNCFEAMVADKAESKTWGKRMHSALKCYHAFLMTVYTMDASRDLTLKESAKVLQSNVFYVVEYREIFLKLLKKFNDSNQTQEFLKDLVLTTHLFLKLFENFCKNNSVVVQKKIKAKQQRLKRKRNQEGKEESLTADEKLMKWNEVEALVKHSLLETVDISTNDVFDPTSDIPETEQQRRALFKIQQSLIHFQHQEAVKVLRTARLVWPEMNLFGANDVTAEQEVSLLQEIILSDLTTGGELEGYPQNDDGQNEEEEVEENEEEQIVAARTSEMEFNFNDYLKKFGDSKVMFPYIKILQTFETNLPMINHCVAKMLHRVGYTCKMYGIFFQVSLFRVFQKIFESPQANTTLKELNNFGCWLMSKFEEVAQRNPVVFMEMLFWKLSPACVYDLTEGYGAFSNISGKKKSFWSDEEKEELKDLYEKYKDSEGDLVSYILSDITSESRTRRQVCYQLVEMGFVDNVSILKKQHGSKTGIWRDDDVEELKRLYEEFGHSDDPIGNIIKMMSNKKSKNKVMEKVLMLGLVHDRKQLYKKHARRPGSILRSEIVHIGGDSSDAETSSDVDQNKEENDDLSTKDLLQLCVSNNFGGEIKWICSNLQNLTEDRKESNLVHSIPLVPCNDGQENAMNDHNFKKLLKSVGLQPPAYEQEMFWRIPASMNVNKLVSVIEQLMPGSDVPNKRDRVENKVINLSDTDVENQPKEKRRRIVISDEEDNNPFSNNSEKTFTQEDEASDSNVENQPKVKRRRIVISDDEDSNPCSDNLHTTSILEDNISSEK